MLARPHTPPLDDKDEEESETNSWDFGFRLDTPKLPQKVERRGRKRKRPAVIFFPKNEKEIVEGEEQRLPSSQVPTQIISENKFSPIPTILEPKRYSLKFPALTPYHKNLYCLGIFLRVFSLLGTQLQLPPILPLPKSTLSLASTPIFSSIFSQTQNLPPEIPLPTVLQPPAPTSLQIDFMPSHHH